MGQGDKKVSVIIPNYNYAHFLQRRIKSILRQTLSIYELIILDDKSSDDSIKIIETEIEKIKKQHPNVIIKTAFNKKNSGNVFKQWAKGINMATGDYVWIAEADDLSEEKFLENIMKGFDDKDVILSYAKSKMIKTNEKISLKRAISQEVLLKKSSHWKKDYINDGKKEIQEVLCIYNTIPNVSAVVFRKNKKISYEQILEKAQKFTVAGDWYFYYKLLLNGKIAYCKKPLNKQTIHSKSVTKTTNRQKYLEEVKMMHNIIDDEISLGKKEKMAIIRQEGYLKKRFNA